MNAYFPTDPQTVNFDQTELLQVQTEIEGILNNSNFDDVLLGGDFNYDKRRFSTFTVSMDRFLEKIDSDQVGKSSPLTLHIFILI